MTSNWRITRRSRRRPRWKSCRTQKCPQMPRLRPYRQDQRFDQSYCFVGERYDERKVLAEW